MTPTAPGWYWLRELDDDRWQVVRVDEEGEVHHVGSEIVSKVTDHHGRYGRWGPRIPEPEELAEMERLIEDRAEILQGPERAPFPWNMR